MQFCIYETQLCTLNLILDLILNLLQNYLLKHLVDSGENTDGTNVTFTGKVRVFFTEGENLCFLTVVRDAAVVDPLREL